MALDEFYKGAQMFLQGMSQLSQSNAIDRARTNLEELQTQKLDLMAKRSAQQEIANQLTFDFMKAQAPIAETQFAAQQFSPKQFAQADAAILEGTLTGNPQLVELGKQADLAAIQPQIQLEQMKEQSAEKRLQANQVAAESRQERSIQAQKDKQAKTVLSDRQKEFNRLTTKDVEAVSKAELVTKILDSKSPLGDNTLPTFFAKASGEVGNLSEADKAPFGGSQALDRKLSRWASIKTGGTIPDSDRAEMKKLANLLKSRSAEKIKEQTLQSAGQIGSAIGGTTEEHIQNLLGASPKMKALFDSSPSQNTKPDIRKYLTPTK